MIAGQDGSHSILSGEKDVILVVVRLVFSID